LVNISPPAALKVKLSEQWFEQSVKEILPLDIQQEQVSLQIMEPFNMKISPAGFTIDLNLRLKYPFKLMGSVSGKAKISLAFSNISDIEMADVKLKELNWLEGPRLELTNFMGFSIRRVLKGQIEKITTRIEASMKSEIPKAFKAFTESNPFYDQYLNQTIPEFSLQVKTKVKTLFYQLIPGNRWLDLQVFPELDLDISDTDNTFIGSPGPFKPGVGGGQINYQLELSTQYIGDLVRNKVRGQVLSAGTKKVVIDDIILGIGNDGLTVNVSFEGNDPPKVNGLLKPKLNAQKQILEFEIQHLEMQEAPWFWRGLFAVLKNNIENRIEESLKINVSQIFKNNTNQIESKLAEVLSEQQLQLKTSKPEFVITGIHPSSKGLTVNGQAGGNF